MKLDFLMPCRIESEDRLKNIITTVSFLLHNFPESNVIVKEVDSRSNFKFRAIPEIKKYVDISNLIHIYEESNEAAFHKTRILNDLLLESKSEIAATIGWGQMIKRQVEINVGMWNENFISWGAEDCEFHYRLNVLNYRVGRVNDIVYHLEHGRTFNSHYNNPKFMDNHNLWQWFRNQDRDTVVKYYENQQYLISRGEKLNAGI